MKKLDQEICAYSAPKSYTMIINNPGKIGASLAVLLIIVFSVSKTSLNQNAMVFCIAFVSLFPWLFGLTQKKFAHKIEIDFNLYKLKFYMLRTNEIVEVSFDEIKKISVKGYIIFNLKERTILCNNAANNDLIRSLKRIMSVV